MAKSMGSGWHLESNRHSLASKGIKTGRKYYAVFDLQTGAYMHSGRNAPTLKKAVDDVWGFWKDGSDLEDKDIRYLEKKGTLGKKRFLESQEFRFDVDKEPFEGGDEDKW